MIAGRVLSGFGLGLGMDFYPKPSPTHHAKSGQWLVCQWLLSAAGAGRSVQRCGHVGQAVALTHQVCLAGIALHFGIRLVIVLVLASQTSF